MNLVPVVLSLFMSILRLLSYIAFEFFGLVYSINYPFIYFYTGPMLIAVLITEIVILHKYVYLFIYLFIIIIINALNQMKSAHDEHEE